MLGMGFCGCWQPVHLCRALSCDTSFCLVMCKWLLLYCASRTSICRKNMRLPWHHAKQKKAPQSKLKCLGVVRAWDPTCACSLKNSMRSSRCSLSIASFKFALIVSKDRHSWAGPNSILLGCMKWQVATDVRHPGGYSFSPQGYFVICGGCTRTGVGKGI